MEPSNSIQSNYDSNAEAYAQFITLPLGTLEQQLLDLCITNLDGQRVLDLGGGTGIRARDALAAGAAGVDVVDISPSMMRIGQDYESSISRDESQSQSQSQSRIRWFEADVCKPLDHLHLDVSGYDLVIANGIFDHASTLAELEGMWNNAARYLRPGGRVVANRNNPLSKCARPDRRGQYGVTFTDFRALEGGEGEGEGVQYKYHMHTSPELVFESKALESYYLAGEEGGENVAESWFEGFENVRWEDTQVVQEDRGFWREYLEDPILYMYTARKK